MLMDDPCRYVRGPSLGNDDCPVASERSSIILVLNSRWRWSTLALCGRLSCAHLEYEPATGTCRGSFVGDNVLFSSSSCRSRAVYSDQALDLKEPDNRCYFGPAIQYVGLGFEDRTVVSNGPGAVDELEDAAWESVVLVALDSATRPL